MLKLRDMTIRQKLMAIIMIPSAAIMLLAVTALVVWEQIDTHHHLLKDIQSHAEMLADNCKASIAFEHKEDAEQVLSTLHVQDSVVLAYIYDKNGRLFARYEREDMVGKIGPIKSQKEGHVFEDGLLSVFRQIVLDDEIIGTVLLMDDMSRVYSELTADILVATVILLVALAAGYFFSSNLQKMISRPILDLAGVAKEVSEKWDYSARAQGESNDEVGYLTQVFNTMLEQIQQRDSALIDAKSQLEIRVRERTADITTANEHLTKEIAERVKAEAKLKRKAEEWITTFDSITDLVSIHDKDFKVVRTNKSFANAFNMKPGEIIGKTCYELVHGTKEPPSFCPHKRTLDTKKPQREEHFEPHLGIYIETSVSPLFDENGQVIASVHIAKNITERKRAETELKVTQEKLVETAHCAGMAEVAADVLHNVGNVLNSINVSTTLITEKIVNSEIENLAKVVGLVNDNAEDLARFFTEHQQGKHIPKYLTEVVKCLASEQTYLVGRLQTLSDNVQHIKDIISVQQSYAKAAGVEVRTSLARLVEDAIQINSAGLERHGARIVREMDELADVEIDKQRVIQILVNLINNAKYALSSSDKKEKLLTIRVHRHNEDRFRIEVEDNGIGISQASLTKIFSHGFTTKQHGHGFGLHSSALAAKDMGGSLTTHSNGVGQGATFTLELPFKPVEVMK